MSIQNNFKCDTGQKAHIWGWVREAINLDAGLALVTPALYIFVNAYLRNNRTPTHRRAPSLMRERLCVIAKISCPLASQPDAQDCSKTKKNLPETKVLQSSLIRMSSETSPGLLESTLAISNFSLVPWIRIHYLFEVLCNCLNLLRSLKFFLNIHSHLTKDKGGISGLMEGKLSFKKY